MVKLDVKDKKLLYYLSENARLSDTQLAKKVQLSKNGVKYRIERLKKEGVIDKFTAVVNLGAFKHNTFSLMLKFNEDIYENKDILNYFKQHPFSNWVISLSGTWDIFAEFVCKDLEHLRSITTELVEHFGELLNSYQTHFGNVLRVEHLVASFYKGLDLEEVPLHPRQYKEIELDKTDRRILNIITSNSSLPYLTIANKLKLTIDIVRYRIKNLMEKGVIIKFFPEINRALLGYTEYLCKITLKNISKEKLKIIKNQIKQNNSITYAFLDINNLNLIFVSEFQDPEEIDHLLRGLRKQYPNIIDKQEYYIVKEQIKFYLFPEGLLQSKP